MQTFFIPIILAFLFVLRTQTQEQEQGPTDCEREKEREDRATTPIRWNVTCDENGNYMSMRCTVTTPRWCACYDRDGQQLTTPSRTTTSCKCVRENDEMKREGKEEYEFSACKANGSYQKRQCRCVNEETGEAEPGPCE